MPRSEYAYAVDKIQRAVRPLLAECGFKVRGRTFNRVGTDGLTHVVNFQMGPSDPPGTTYVPGLTASLHGLFTINLGVYVPEVAEHQCGAKAGAWVQEHYCCVRGRLREDADVWWHARADDDIISDVSSSLETDGFGFFERFATRDQILHEWRNRSENMGASSPPRIVKAIILQSRGEAQEATQLLVAQAKETQNPGHPEYVRELASRLGLTGV